MKQLFVYLFLSLPFIHTAQNNFDCEQLAIDFIGVLETEKSKQIIIEVSNQVYTGSLYYYPGFLLLNEDGDTIAREEVRYYGIGLNFQRHTLDLLANITFPFTGVLELHGSYYQHKFCSFPIEILDIATLSTEELEVEALIVSSNFSNKDLIIDLGAFNINAEKLDYYISISNDDQAEVFKSHLDLSVISIPIKDLGGKGIYYLSIWDANRKELLPIEIIEID